MVGEEDRAMVPSTRPTQDATPRWVLATPALASTAVGALCTILFGIWIFCPWLKVFSGHTMKANSALGLLCGSGALWLLRYEGGRHAALRKRWGSIFAAAALAIGTLTSLEYLVGWDLGIDQLITEDFIEEETLRFPGRMSPIASASFVFLGLALLAIDVPPTKRGLHTTSAMVLPFVLATLLALVGYLFGVRDFYQFGPFIRIAWPTALCFFVLGIGTLAARPHRGPIRFFASSRLSGTASRRLLPAVILIPLAFGWIELWAMQQGYVGLELATALVAVSLLVVLCGLVWLYARSLDAADRDREKSEELFRSFFRLGLVGMAQADAGTGKLLQVNTKMEEITGHSMAELRGMTFAEMTHPDDRARDLEGISELVQGKRLTYVAEKRYVKKDGSIVWVLLNAAAVRDHAEGVQRTVAVVQDITSLMQAQENLERAVRIRDEFLSIASHELKTPLTALLMQIQSVQRGIGTGPAALQHAGKLAKAYASGLRLEKLINDLLDVSRITAGRLTLHAERMDLSAAVRDVAENFRETAEKAGSELRMQTNGAVVGTWDRMRVEQVLTNLLSNALKYGSGRPVDVTIERGDEEAIVCVTDHGIGIPAEKQRRIFERFERGVDPRDYGGFGLGLWIAKQVVHASGGSIEVESELGEGARFVLRLPIRPEHEARSSG
jgi:PAS domain S-box-containing protein